MQLCVPEFSDTDRSTVCCKPACPRSFINGDLIYLIEWHGGGDSYMESYSHGCGEHLMELVPDDRTVTWIQAIQEPQIKHIDVVFDGPPGHVAGRFVEVENAARASIGAGEWVERDDGYWVLRLPVNAGWLVG